MPKMFGKNLLKRKKSCIYPGVEENLHPAEPLPRKRFIGHEKLMAGSAIPLLPNYSKRTVFSKTSVYM